MVGTPPLLEMESLFVRATLKRTNKKSCLKGDQQGEPFWKVWCSILTRFEPVPELQPKPEDCLSFLELRNCWSNQEFLIHSATHGHHTMMRINFDVGVNLNDFAQNPGKAEIWRLGCWAGSMGSKSSAWEGISPPRMSYLLWHCMAGLQCRVSLCVILHFFTVCSLHSMPLHSAALHFAVSSLYGCLMSLNFALVGYQGCKVSQVQATR